jgi:hypothetical protein
MKYTKEVLETAARDSKSIAKVLRKLGTKWSGSSHGHIKRRLLHFKSTHLISWVKDTLSVEFHLTVFCGQKFSSGREAKLGLERTRHGSEELCLNTELLTSANDVKGNLYGKVSLFP